MMPSWSSVSAASAAAALTTVVSVEDYMGYPPPQIPSCFVGQIVIIAALSEKQYFFYDIYSDQSGTHMGDGASLSVCCCRLLCVARRRVVLTRPTDIVT